MEDPPKLILGHGMAVSQVRTTIIKGILATDMIHHFELVTKLKERLASHANSHPGALAVAMGAGGGKGQGSRQARRTFATRTSKL